MSSQVDFSVEQPTKDRLVLGGEVDLSNAPQVKAALDAWLNQRLPSYTLDLRPLTRIDSSGLGLVVGAYRRAITQKRPKAAFQVYAGGPILRVIQLIGLDKVLPIVVEETQP